ncbi:3-phosphoshikimate 1-carboxyvinyltransferase [Candidatus Neptunochlamydia vexilliferae]|uniref:3-phosphoshikimate 1-carboxyvinyltransferase n=1 Tax=Candidatus Neptunichlamydia vexilliferae TaxID=1651774 RepID=UPI0018914B56|nr:3-phosphoshikimate 1-carboxyvinyltransferase [Candidatus Neptunochlamydia vexilliferae]
MHYQVEPSSLSGYLTVPPSKSHTHRALLFALLAEGTSVIHHPLDSPDTTAMLRVIEQFGARVTQKEEVIEVEGVGGNLSHPEQIINAGNSGIILRFVSALAALRPSHTLVTGDESICTRRPMNPLLGALEELGSFAKSLGEDGFAPLAIRGPFKGGKCSLNGSDSQPVSALLIAASFAKEPTEITVESPGEKPWIDLTLDWLNFLGLPYENDDYTHYKIPGGGRCKGFTKTIPGDFSSLAFPLAAALITQREISLENVDKSDIQGDKKLLDVLEKIGAKMTFEGKTLHIQEGGPLQGMEVDINSMIDALPILAVLGCYAQGKMTLTGGAVAREKESDRIAVMAQELRKMGAEIEEKKDGLIIIPSPLHGAELDSHGDHRVAMALTVAAMGAKGPSTVHNTACIAKTYPKFKERFNNLGAKIT